MSKGGRFIALAASAILLSVVSLVSLSSQAEEREKPNTTGYPAVEDVPPRPDKPVMTADEQLKLKKELSATRDRQAPKGNARGVLDLWSSPDCTRRASVPRSNRR
jgi:hypothetical protein